MSSLFVFPDRILTHTFKLTDRTLKSFGFAHVTFHFSKSVSLIPTNVTMVWFITTMTLLVGVEMFNSLWPKITKWAFKVSFIIMNILYMSC